MENQVVNFMEMEKINISTLDLTLGIIAKGRQYGCRRLDKKSLKQRSMAREEASQAQVALPQFEINAGNVEVFGKEVASHPLMISLDGKPFLNSLAFLSRGAAKYRRLKTIVGQMQNKILQVESDDCDNETQLKLNSLKLENKDLQTKLIRRKIYPLREVFNGLIRPRDMDIDGLLSLDPYMLVDEGKGAAGPSGLANDGVDVIPQDKEMGVVGANMVFVQQVAPVSNKSMIFEETPETAQTYKFCNN
ncbi:uncharacterized protein G2W53_027061 [Senna tora]|uniref:Uncharacterized protein n=1 Tax=Senna tora TaxID=362788 RepID=A0A834TIL2_9FABA|nr:uncharacterized protein G2W53_027061 [Senna tora]